MFREQCFQGSLTHYLGISQSRGDYRRIFTLCYLFLDEQNYNTRALRKHLLSFLVTLVKSLSQYTKAWRLDEERIFIGDLAYALALNLDLADNPQFYDLPVLETSLVCLAHITAQPHWSSYCKFSQGMSLCIQLMTSLVQVRVLL